MTRGPRSPSCCGGRGRPTRCRRAPHDAGDHPRHHGAGRAVRRRRGDGGGPAGHLGEPGSATSTMEKVFPADRFSGVAIAGAAGPAVEMVKLFQLQLEHYEKVEGTVLSLEGKANQLGQMVRSNLPGRHAGPRPSCRCSPATTSAAARAGCSSTTSPAAATRSRTTSSPARGSLHAGTVVKLGFRDGLTPRRGHRPRRPRAVPRRRGGLRHRRARPHPRDLPRRGHDHRRRATSGSTTTSSAPGSRRSSPGGRRS